MAVLLLTLAGLCPVEGTAGRVRVVPTVLLSCSQGGRSSTGHAGLFLLPVVRQELPPAGPDPFEPFCEGKLGELTAGQELRPHPPSLKMACIAEPDVHGEPSPRLVVFCSCPPQVGAATGGGCCPQPLRWSRVTTLSRGDAGRGEQGVQGAGVPHEDFPIWLGSS